MTQAESGQIQGNDGGPAAPPPAETPGVVPGPGSWRIPFWRTLLFCGLAGLTVYLCVASPQTVAGSSAGVVMELPVQVLDFKGLPEAPSKAEKDVLPPDTEFEKRTYVSRSMFSQSADILSCGIVLSGRDRRSIHRPQVCLDAQGWRWPDTEVIPVELSNGKTLWVSKLSLSMKNDVGKERAMERRAIFLYWFVGKDVSTPRSMTRVVRTAWDNVFRSVNHRWAYVSLMAPVTEGLQFDGKNDEETLAMLKEFMREAVPQFQTAF